MMSLITGCANNDVLDRTGQHCEWIIKAFSFLWWINLCYTFSNHYNTQGSYMKQLLFSLLISLTMFSFAGWGEEQKPQEPAMKCEAGKCGQGKCGDQ